MGHRIDASVADLLVQAHVYLICLQVCRTSFMLARKHESDEASLRKASNVRQQLNTLFLCQGRRVHHPHVCTLLGNQMREDAPDVQECVCADVVDWDCVDVAIALASQPDAKIWMLNMACSGAPGGGAMKGCNAQEEHICRCTDLLPQLWKAKGQYPLISQTSSAPDFKVLVHSSVQILKSGDYKRLANPPTVGILTAAAERVGGPGGVIGGRVGANIERFINYLLDVVSMQDCTHVILSAWGCGAFRQDPSAVAQAFAKALRKKNASEFPKVIFAIIDDHNSADNLSVFRGIIQ